MPIIFNQADRPARAAGDNVAIRTLIDAGMTSNDNVRLERWEMGAAGAAPLQVADGDIVWIQILGGNVMLDGSEGRHDLSDVHLVFLPGGFAGEVTSAEGAVMLHARVPDAARFDPAFAADPPAFRVVDWSEEPVLNSEHDARKRIYFVTPTLFGTKAIAGEMIIYPAGTEASNHWHEGAEHFQYVTAGSGLCYSNGEPHRIKQGDVVYNYERERHYFVNDTDEEMVFVEFFIPGVFETIWVDDAPVCTWQPTGRNIKGGTASRHIAGHAAKASEMPAEV